MAIFSRRSIQRMLDESRAWMPLNQLQRYLPRLNNPKSDHLAAEWELAVLSALAKSGSVEHEVDLGGETRPDIHFTAGSGERFVAEITTVSDTGLHRENPYDALYEELRVRTSRIRDKRISGSFSLEVGNFPTVLGQAAKLKLPRQHSFKKQIFNERFHNFLNSIVAVPHLARQLQIKDEQTDVTIRFQPDSGFSGGGHLSYTVLYSKTQNPIYNSLAAKAGQLKKTAFTGIKGIFLCDGDCQILRTKIRGWATYTVSDVIEEFFRQHHSIAFVFLLSVKNDGSLNIGPTHLSLKVKLFTNPWTEVQPSRLEDLLNNLYSSFPHPARLPANARNGREWSKKAGRWHEGDSFIGGCVVSDTSVKISARAVLQFLSGAMDADAFRRAHGNHNPFQTKLKNGQLIKGVSVLRSSIPDDDDEWLLFEFTEPDPAIKPFSLTNMPTGFTDK